jgi:hypothetical protein
MRVARACLINDLKDCLVPGSGCCRVQQIAHGGDRLAIAADDLPDVRPPHFYLEQDLLALFNLRYPHLIRCLDQMLNHKLEEVLHKTNQA